MSEIIKRRLLIEKRHFKYLSLCEKFACVLWEEWGFIMDENLEKIFLNNLEYERLGFNSINPSRNLILTEIKIKFR